MGWIFNKIMLPHARVGIKIYLKNNWKQLVAVTIYYTIGRRLFLIQRCWGIHDKTHLEGQ